MFRIHGLIIREAAALVEHEAEARQSERAFAGGMQMPGGSSRQPGDRDLDGDQKDDSDQGRCK